jgi:uncharacterized membrane protein
MLGVAENSLAGGPTFTSIDHPGAVLATEANGIFRTGTGQILIVGDYVDSTGKHGYLLSGGTFTNISFPLAPWTQAYAINAGGDIVGNYSLTDLADLHGYLLHDGNFTSFDFPDAGRTSARGIDTAGNIVGWYETNTSGFGVAGSPQRHGFLLSGGAFTSIDFPGAIETEAWRIIDQGPIIGRYKSPTDGKNHLFRLCQRFHIIAGVPCQGFYTIADVPGAVETAGEPNEISGGGINPAGDITSDYCSSETCDPNIKGFVVDLKAAGHVHGFLLSKGVYTTIDFPGAIVTLAFDIDHHGDIVGGWVDSSGHIHGYLRTPGP